MFEVRGLTYVSVVCNCKHIQGKLPHFFIGTQVKLTKKLLRAQRALPQTRLRVLRQKSAWTSAANSAQILKEIAEVLKSFPSKQGVVLLDCAPAHLPRQVMAMARKCKLQLVYIPAQTTDYLQPLDLQGFSPFKQYLKRKHQELRSYSASSGLAMAVHASPSRILGSSAMAEKLRCSGLQWPRSSAQSASTLDGCRGALAWA